MPLQNKDFVEIEFTGRIKDGEIFDSNIEKDIKKAELKIEAKPFKFCLGTGMFLKGIDDFLVGKEIGKKYEVELTPEKAFGNRDSKLVQVMPMKVFAQQKVDPVPGAMFNFDGRIAKVLSVSGGRVIVDFNPPLAGKTVIYNINILRKIEDKNEQIRTFNEFLFKKDFKFEITGKKLMLHVDKQMVNFVEMFKDKFKEVLELDLEVREIEEGKEEAKASSSKLGQTKEDKKTQTAKKTQ